MNEAGVEEERDPESVADAEPRLVPFVFSGTTGEFFRIWIVNIVLSLLTLGIYSAWAKVRTHRYFFGSTKLDGRPFEYTADPIAILKGRAIAVGAFLIWYLASHFYPLFSLVLLPPLLIAIPWVIVRSMKFRTFNTRYRGLRFHFHGTYMEALKAYILLPMLTLFTLGALWPYVSFRRAQFKMNNLGFGDRRSSFFGDIGAYYAIWFGLLGYIVVAFIAMVFVAVITAAGGEPESLSQMSPRQVANMVLLYIVVVFGIYVFPPAYLKAREGNYLLNHSQTAGFLPHSNMKVLELFWIYASNIVAIVFTLGLAIPWAMIRTTRYRLDRTALEVRGDLGDIAAGDRQLLGAAGEELGEVFDIEIGF